MLLPSRLEYPLSSEHISCRVALWSQIGIRLLLYWLWSQNRLMELDLRDVLNWNSLQSIAFRSGPVAPWHWEPVSRTPGSLSARSAADPGPCFLVRMPCGLMCLWHPLHRATSVPLSPPQLLCANSVRLSLMSWAQPWVNPITRFLGRMLWRLGCACLWPAFLGCVAWIILTSDFWGVTHCLFSVSS